LVRPRWLLAAGSTLMSIAVEGKFCEVRVR
jgi:hypothetical protein